MVIDSEKDNEDEEEIISFYEEIQLNKLSEKFNEFIEKVLTSDRKTFVESLQVFLHKHEESAIEFQ